MNTELRKFMLGPAPEFQLRMGLSPAEFFTYNIRDGGSETYDVLFGPGGFLYVADSVDGIRVLKCKGKGKSGK
jgi:hypothetical protein